MPNRMLRDWTGSDKMKLVSAETERFFIRLIMKADDYGCYYGDVRLLRASLYPLIIDKIKTTQILRCIEECVNVGLIEKYESGGKSYLNIKDFDQRLRAKTSKYPMPTGQSINEQGYVYLLHSETDGQHKIGYSLNPWSRAKEVKYSAKKVVVLTMTFKGTQDQEKEIHKLLRNHNKNGEWFLLPVHVITVFKSVYERKLSASELIVAIRSFSSEHRSERSLHEVEEEVEVEKEEKGRPPDFLGATSYDAEQTILANPIRLEQIAMTTGVDMKTALGSLHKYHLHLEEKEQYPKGVKSVFAGFEKWLLNEKNFTPANDSEDKMKKLLRSQ